MSVYFQVFELIGTVAFACSGAIEGIKHKMDLFGVVVLGMVTAVGGGILRDLIIGNTPPAVFKKPLCAGVAAVTSVIMFVIIYYLKDKFKQLSKTSLEKVLFFADSIGLAAFTVIGIEMTESMTSNKMVLVFVGVVTGVGGGMFRDVFCGDIPMVFRKYVYATASLSGAVIVVILKLFMISEYAAIIGLAVVFIIRLFSAVFRWNLPRVRIDI